VSTTGSDRPWVLSVYALIRNRRGRLLFVRRAAAASTNAGKWDLPGGKVEAGEALEDALQREIREEVGLTTRFTDLRGSVAFAIKRVRVAALIFDAVSRSSKVRLSPEHDAFAWVRPREVSRLDLCSYFGPLPVMVQGRGVLSLQRVRRRSK
jgi:8-oxo-dGTP diphosphatase